MRALMYLTKRCLINNLKKAVRKPVTLLIIIGCIAYIVFLVNALGEFLTLVGFDSVKGMVMILTLTSLYFFIANFLSYSARKGIIFRPSHAHFIFPAPVSPKAVLVHGAWMNYVLSTVLYIAFAFGGVFWFHAKPGRMLLYLLVSAAELVLEVSLMICLYSNERIGQKTMKKLCFALKVVLGAITAVILLYFWRNGVTFESAAAFFDWPILQMLPVIGWNIAAYRLVLLGPTALNIAGAVLYFLTAAGLFLLAFRMKCEGGYYEDAAKFADSYAEMVRRKKNGEMVMGMEEKKKKFRSTKGNFSATGAKAILYRQLLEYRKERFFIFSKITVYNLVLALFMAFILRNTASELGQPQLVMLGIAAYMTLIMSGYLGKWEAEIKNPYLYLIPDSPFKKLWYSTVMEHVKALADGILICVPMGIMWKIAPLPVILTILIYAVLQANKMYTKVIAQCVVEDTLGKKGQDVVRMILQMMILGIGITAAAIAGVVFDVDLVFPIVLIYSMIVTVVIGLIAAIRFDSMEQSV